MQKKSNNLPRLKTYSAESGYVYQYYFLESRPVRRLWSRLGTAFLFNVSADCKNYTVVPVLVEDQALAEWEKEHGRALVEQERYAAAKMQLFRAFDEALRPESLQETSVTAANIESLLEPLGLDG